MLRFHIVAHFCPLLSALVLLLRAARPRIVGVVAPPRPSPSRLAPDHHRRDQEPSAHDPSHPPEAAQFT
jgi:hypothetical protein